MFLKHKIKKGETFDSIQKKYKVSAPSAIWNLPQNRALVRKRKTKDKLAPGDEIYVPDPKAKCHILKIRNTTYVVADSEWNSFQDIIIQKLQKTTLKRAKAHVAHLDEVFEYHKKNAKEFSLSYGLTKMLSGASLPNTEMIQAGKDVNDLEMALRSRNFAKASAAMTQIDKSTKAYADGLNTYVKKLTGAGDKAIFGLELTRDVSFIVVGACAMAVVAPAGAGALTMMKVGAGVGGATSAAKSIANEIGEAVAGNDRSFKEVSTSVLMDTLMGAGTGAFAALIGPVIMKGAVERLASGLLSSKTLTKICVRLFSSERGWLDKALNGTISRLSDVYGKKVAAEIATRAMSKTIGRIGFGGMVKLVEAGIKAYHQQAMAAFRSFGSKASGKEDEKKTAQMIGDELYKAGLGTSVIKSAIEANAKAIIADIEANEMKMAA